MRKGMIKSRDNPSIRVLQYNQLSTFAYLIHLIQNVQKGCIVCFNQIKKDLVILWIVIGVRCIQQKEMISESDDSGWPLIAAIIYTTAWCLSFYGQIYENYRLKSVQGFSLNYFAFSLTGYTYYTVYLTIGAFTDFQGAGTIVLGDMIFIYHTVFVVIIQLIQCIIYDKGKNKLSPKTVIIISSVTLVIVLETILTVCDVVQWYTYWNPLTVVGYGKLVMTFVKCTPEVYWNYQRKSTKGWSILGIFLDLIGGTFSFASGGISVENGLNLIKVILGFISVIYDLIFCFQHYVLYRQRQPQPHEQAPISQKLLTFPKQSSIISQESHISK